MPLVARWLHATLINVSVLSELCSSYYLCRRLLHQRRAREWWGGSEHSAEPGLLAAAVPLVLIQHSPSRAAVERHGVWGE